MPLGFVSCLWLRAVFQQQSTNFLVSGACGVVQRGTSVRGFGYGRVSSSPQQGLGSIEGQRIRETRVVKRTYADRVHSRGVCSLRQDWLHEILCQQRGRFAKRRERVK